MAVAVISSGLLLQGSALAVSSYNLIGSDRPSSGTSGLTPNGYPQFIGNDLVYSTYAPQTLQSYTSFATYGGATGYDIADYLTGDYANDPANAFTTRSYASADLNSDGTDDMVYKVNGQSVGENIDDIVIDYSSGEEFDAPNYANDYYCNPGGSGYDTNRSPAIADIDHDGQPDILTNQGCALYLLSNKGNLIKSILPSLFANYSDSHFVKNPALGDFNGDTYTDIVVAGQFKTSSSSADEYYIGAVDYKGTKIWNYSLGAASPEQPIVADLNKDGTNEIVVCTSQKLEVLNYDGTVKWSNNTPCYGASVSNIDADSELEIIYQTNSANSSDSTINIVNGNTGTTLAGYPLVISNSVICAPILSLKLSSADTTNDLLVPTDGGLRAFRGSDKQALWILNAGESCEYAAVKEVDGKLVLAYQGSHLTSDSVVELFVLKDDASDLSPAFQHDTYPMPGYSPQQTFNTSGAPLKQADGGYWLVASDGGVFPFGKAVGYGSTGNIKLAKPMVGMAATSNNQGYWLVAADGGVFPFGNAVGKGSTGNIRLNQPVVGIEPTNSGNGYWLVASDGGIFPFGDAVGYGSAGNINLFQPIVGMQATSTGNGYYLTAADGGIFTYGDARYYGSTGDIRLFRPIIGTAAYK